MKKPIVDQLERDLALDPEQSFIVQAPAGSGKTELLIQRFLVLLARVAAPEEVIAITFTRKAATEMRERILSALKKAASSISPPSTSHAQKTWELAWQVLNQDQRYGWHLLENPGRLRLQTIDSLAHQIVRQAPLMSEFTAVTEIAEHADWLYALAVRNLFCREEEGGVGAQDRAALKQLLIHLNNDVARLESLLTDMLAKRDQWLEHVVRPRERDHLENTLKHVNQTLLAQACCQLPEACKAELLSLLQFSEDNTSTDQPLIDQLPGASLEDKPAWEKIARFLLRKDFKYRESVTQALGFPPESAGQTREEKCLFKAMKLRFKALLAEFKSDEAFRRALQAILESPATAYHTSQWHILSALIQVLKRLLAELKLVFYEKKRVDFTEILLAAREALGTEDQPTELGLLLDYKVQHLLMDEFQDTSMMQFKLVERLVSGWQPGDGRTLFLVGDPMQSIYRFRQAEVGLFLMAQKIGIGQVTLTPLTLKVNFRSESGLLAWINQRFDQIFPVEENVQLGAVSFSPSVAFHETRQTVSVLAHAVSPEKEGEMMVALIQEKWRLDPQHKIAILVRSRSHLERIIPTLVQAGLNFQALDIAALKEQPVIYDLYALTRVLLSPIDRLAWFSVLRAPWCGLSLEDLHALGCVEGQPNFFSLLEAIPETMSEEGRNRFQKVGGVLVEAIENRNRARISYWVRSVWLALKGSICYESEHAVRYADDFFELLDQLEKEMGFVDLVCLEARLDNLFAGSSEEADERLQLMTIHKSKGLEFDSVIIPGLERRSKGDTAPILRWLEQAYLEEETGLILAPMRAAGQEPDAIYEYLGSIEKNKQKQERVRLLYVAATRAKSCLHWVMCCTDMDEKVVPPGSFLSLLGSLTFESSVIDPMGPENALPTRDISMRRLSSAYFDPSYKASLEEGGELDVSSFGQTSHTFQEKIGTVIHHLLDQVIKQGAHQALTEDVPLWKKWMLRAGILPHELSLGIEKIRRVIQVVRTDSMAQWILDSSHRESQSEYAVTLKQEEGCQHFRIDRTFIDEKGRRWIIDYKSSMPEENERLSDFLDEMKKRYGRQLHVYGQLMQALGSEPVFFGLYFPLIPAWCEWAYCFSGETELF